MAVRLNKYLADRGVGARRKCDELIAQGRVSVNGRVVSEAGSKVEEERDRVSVDGRPVGGRARHVYYVLNKPVGVITTLEDPHGRRSIAEFLPRGARVYPVGRLDADTSGLLLLTNDGELAHKLMHPRYGVQKVYRVRLAAEPRADQLRRLAQGVRFDPERNLVSGPARVRRIDPGFDAIMIELIIHEGRFRQVRRMCEAVGLVVTGLHRVGYGPIRLGPLARGMFRELSEAEVAQLREAASRPGGPGYPRSRPATGRPAAPARPAAAAAPEWVPDDEEDEEVEETFIPGGGVLQPVEETFPEPGDEPAWPARAGGRRGDADWQAERAAAPAPTARPERAGPRPGGRAPGRRAEQRAARGGSRATAPAREAGGGRFERGAAPRGAAGRGSARAEREGGRFERGAAPRGAAPRGGPRSSAGERGFERRPAPRASEGRGGPRPDRGGGARFERRSGGRGKPARRGGAPARPFEKFERRPSRSAAPGRAPSRGERGGERFERGGAERGPARPSGRMGERTPARGGRGPTRPANGRAPRPARRGASRAPASGRGGARNPSRARRG